MARWLRAIVALDNDEVGNQVPVSNLLVGLILRRVIARERRRIIGKLNHDMQRTGGAFRNRKLLCADQIASPEFIEDWMITCDVSFDRFLVFYIHSHNPVTLRHLTSPLASNAFACT